MASLVPDSVDLQTPARLEDITPSTGFPYRVEERVGEGSMGVVYRAVEPTLGRAVAIKVLKLDLRGSGTDATTVREMRLRFVQEARSAAAIQHPGAVTIYRAGTVGGKPFIAMEWLGGETLAALLARAGPLTLQQAIDVSLQVLETLQAAHDSGVIHRDIKPSNLVLLRDGRVKVTDFGIARFREADLLRTHAGLMLGTPGYAAPEQLRGEDVDARADLFSLGMVLYETLSGHPPFQAGGVLELATKILHEVPRPIETVRPEVPAELAEILGRALAKNRAERWPSARAMTAALQTMVGQPQRPSSWSDSLRTAREATATLPAQVCGPSYRGLPAQLPLALAHLVSSWSAQSLPAQPIERTLRQLLERPLHAPAFSGGVFVGDRLLLVHDGYVLGAVDRRTGQTGEEVSVDLASAPNAQLHALPEGLPPRTLEVLAGMLGVTAVRQAGLDSTILYLQGLSESLAREQLDGVLRLRRGDDEGRVVLVGGRPVMAFFSGAWAGVEIERTWTSWISHVPLSIDVETVRAVPLDLTWRVTARDIPLLCERQGSTRATRGSGGVATRRLPLLARRLEPSAESVVLAPAQELEGSAARWRQAPASRLLEWLLTEGATHFANPQQAARWKYLAEWLPRVCRARLYATPAAAEGRKAALFEAVTLDDTGKILHLIQRLSIATVSSFRLALEQALAEKRACLESGDIGGVVFVAPHFPQDVISLYLETIESNARGLQKLQESLTGYAGFVRLGPRRGFHLLLVEDRSGTLVPLDL